MQLIYEILKEEVILDTLYHEITHRFSFGNIIVYNAQIYN